jgi:hypothetical protein
MNDAKHIALDVHQATICATVLDSAGNLVMEAILETKTETILQFLGSRRGGLRVTFEEGTWAACLHDLLKPQVMQVLICDTRKTGLGKTRTAVIARMPAGWRGSCIELNWSRSTTARTASVPCENWHARTWRSRGISPE